MKTHFVAIGAGYAAAAVLCGAFGRHILSTRLDAHAMQWFHTAVEYHFWHALGLIVVGLAAQVCTYPTRALYGAAYCIFIGNLLFSGSLYLLSITAWRGLVWFTPLGGLLMISGWCALACLSWPRRRPS